MDPRQVLGVAPDASLAEAEDAYRRLLLIHHPDLHQDADPAQRAEAERTTRQLTAAIARLRAGTGTPEPLGAPDAPGSWPTGARSTGSWSSASSSPGSGPPGSGSPGSWSPGEPGSWTTCPMCGSPYQTFESLRAHVAEDHDIHFDERLRPAKVRRRRRRGRSWRRLGFTSPWALLPVNALAALALATAAAQVTHDVNFARWTFAVAMAPTIIRTLTRGHGD